jgi:hypothetical protein
VDNGQGRHGQQRRHAGRSRRHREQNGFLRKPAAWLGGLLTVVAAGVLVSVLSVQASRIVPPPSTAKASVKQAFTGNPKLPLTIVSEDPLNVDDVDNYAFPNRLVLSVEQLKYINRQFFKAINDPSKGKLPSYLASRGGYALSNVNTQVVVQNNGPELIRILSIEVVKSCTSALDGTLFYAPGQSGDPSIQLGFNLDIADDAARVTGGGGPPTLHSPHYFSRYTISVKPGHQQVLDMDTYTVRQSCSFRYRVTLLDGTKKEYELIGNGVNPFRISALAEFSKYSMIYAGGDESPARSEDWVSVDPKKYKGI